MSQKEGTPKEEYIIRNLCEAALERMEKFSRDITKLPNRRLNPKERKEVESLLRNPEFLNTLFRDLKKLVCMGETKNKIILESETEKDRSRIRIERTLAYLVVGGAIVLWVLGAIIGLLYGKNFTSSVLDYFKGISSVLGPLVGVVIGFYFGQKR